uniref:Acetyltransferase n=1 Tax=Angiostrongylus cantonensis TaxID=6313 RepID=A0A0K0DR95_ANGCA
MALLAPMSKQNHLTIIKTQKLIDFVRECGQSLIRLRLETDPWNSVEYQLSDTDATAGSACLIYAHDNDAILQQLLIMPMFHVMNEDRPCPSTMTLRIGWREKPAMALQAAFHIAMTRHQRSQVQVLILVYGRRTYLKWCSRNAQDP